MHYNSTRVLDSSVSCSTRPNGAVLQPFRNVVVGDYSLLEHHDLPSWTALVEVSESEESVDELALVKKTKPLKVQQPSSRISGIYSVARHSPDPLSLQEVLQATFNANGLNNISLPATPIDNEGSCPDMAVVPSKQRLLIQKTRRSTSEAVSDTSLPNATTGTAIPKIASRKIAPSIPYESMQEVIDAALDTRVASITWRRPRYTTRNRTNRTSHVGVPSTKRVPFEDAIFHCDAPTATHQGDNHQEFRSELAPAKDDHSALPRTFTRMFNRVRPAAVPRQSNGEKFNKRLFAMFGGATRPHSLAPGWITRETPDSTLAFVSAREAAAHKAPSPISSSDSATSLAQITEATSVASDRHDVSKKRSYTESDLKDEPVRKKLKIRVDEDQVLEWVTALQRLVKGKTPIDHKGMDHLSVVLAEIESAYLHMDSEPPQVTRLQDVLQQLARLENIPFRDKHNLRQRAEDIFAE
ncbi:hypothetical protein AZE42_03481 [Rhizopogon vesiculosus]|uniref:Uncharacterized protein n=1 Tax=Rhizopogon vesiculosus TaxID=180088 RepID=A0A1J8QX16_9AGAM|nr:hypothetical protein AZE42_03481 [Rhizopogon vesiculosus]